MKGVIDRFEGEFAIIVLDDGEIKNIKKERLPSQAKEGDVIILGDFIYIDYEETERRRKNADKHLGLWED